MSYLISLVLSMALMHIDCASCDQADYSYLIFPNPEEKICLVISDDGQRKMLSGRKVTDETPLTTRILKELKHPYHQSVIKLNQCSRNFSNNCDGPNVLFLSQNEGGFLRHGLILIDDGQELEYPDLNYVDLVIDEDALDRGELYIFSHELGHVMMKNIWPELGNTAGDRLSPKQHVSMGTTDYFVAFFEGWAISFEMLANAVETYRNAFDSSFDYNRFHSSLWHSNIDKELRLNSVRQNEYIFQKALPSNLFADEASIESLILLEHTSPMFDKTRLKNAQQMLSCEGFIATLFSKINANKTLQNNYQDKAFYRKFLHSDIPDNVDARDIFTPFENVILKNFWVWDQMNIRDEALREKALLIEFIEEWCRSFPEDREEILTLFVSLSIGKTISNEPGDGFEKMACFGLIGEYFKYRELLGQYQESITGLLKELLSNKVRLDDNLGPELWIRNPAFLIRQVLWSDTEKLPLAVNLNTASEYEIAAVFGMSADVAKRIVSARDEKGFFESLDELKPFGVDLEQESLHILK